MRNVGWRVHHRVIARSYQITQIWPKTHYKRAAAVLIGAEKTFCFKSGCGRLKRFAFSFRIKASKVGAAVQVTCCDGSSREKWRLIERVIPQKIV
nr:hypothetical protein Iba_chr11eCG9620 [Ipomoea batatas]